MNLTTQFSEPQNGVEVLAWSFLFFKKNEFEGKNLCCLLLQ